MRVHSEKGEGKLTSLIWLLVFGALGLAAWHIAPVYIDNGYLKDKMVEVARLPRGTTPDEKILDALMKYVREERLGGTIGRSSFKIGTLDTSRRITVEYDRTEEILPGWKYTWHFKEQVDQVLVW